MRNSANKTEKTKLVRVLSPSEFPKAVILLQHLTRIERTRLLQVIESPIFGFNRELKDFFVIIRDKCRSNYSHPSLSIEELKRTFASKEKKRKKWLNYRLSELNRAIEITLNLEFHNENTAYGAYINVINQIKFKQSNLYLEAVDELEKELEVMPAFDPLTPYLNYQLSMMRDADMEDAMQRRHHVAYQHAFAALDKFYLLETLMLGIELSNKRDIHKQSVDVQRVSEMIKQPQYMALMTDPNVQVLVNIFHLYNTEVNTTGFVSGVERLWSEVMTQVNPRNFMLCHHTAVLIIRCINIGYTNFRAYYMELIEAMYKNQLYTRKGSITSATLKNIVKLAVDEGKPERAEYYFNTLYPLLADDLNGLSGKLMKAMILKAKGDLGALYSLLSETYNKAPFYEKLTLYRLQIQAEYESANTIENTGEVSFDNLKLGVENLQKFLLRHHDELPADKVSAHKNFIEALKKLKTLPAGNEKQATALKAWIDNCGIIAEKGWLSAQIALKK
jgi:hypothetical protein